VYVAQSYYKMDYFDVSLEILQGYLSADPNSIIATNLKACNHFHMYNGKNAEDVLKPLVQAFKNGDIFKDSDLLRHNLVVFRNG
jgi:intraflagellar transport protein 56